MIVSKETVIGDLLDHDRSVAPYFFEMGMHCLGCPASAGETIEEACAVHGATCEELVTKLNAHLAKTAQSQKQEVHAD
jgi:hybrid cluster-associated redox disulfide protein